MAVNNTMNKVLVISGLMMGVLSASAYADPTCTKESKENWIPFEQAKQQVMDQGYSIKKFKVTKTGCYELYGKDSEGKRVEIYYNPTNMQKVKEEIDD